MSCQKAHCRNSAPAQVDEEKTGMHALGFARHAGPTLRGGALCEKHATLESTFQNALHALQHYLLISHSKTLFERTSVSISHNRNHSSKSPPAEPRDETQDRCFETDPGVPCRGQRAFPPGPRFPPCADQACPLQSVGPFTAVVTMVVRSRQAAGATSPVTCAAGLVSW